MPRINYRAKLNLLVAVRGHPFDRNALDALFGRMEGVAATMVDQPAAAALMNPEGMAGFDALVLYDMPGIDLGQGLGQARLIEPSDTFKEGFEALLRSGKGVLAMHHALASWPSWDSYAEYLGGRFLYLPGRLRGLDRPDSGYLRDVTYEAEVVAKDHPIVEGVPDRFELRDELYLAEIFEPDVVPLLRARYDFSASRFHSAKRALDGHLDDRTGWRHEPGSNLIGWYRKALASPLVYLQPGDGASAYTNPHYQRLLENAVRWLGAPERRV